jgi:hypothetical protein
MACGLLPDRREPRSSIEDLPMPDRSVPSSAPSRRVGGQRTTRRIKTNPGSTESVPSRDVVGNEQGQPKPAVRRRRPAGDEGPAGPGLDTGRGARSDAR